MKVAIGSDHAGFALKAQIIGYLEEKGYSYRDFGTMSPEPVDSADYAIPLARAVAAGEFDRGILVCGTGIGMSILANKTPGVRCALLSDTFSAKATRRHNDANVMSLGARVTGVGLALELVEAFLGTEFSGEPRFVRRLKKLAEYENEIAHGIDGSAGEPH